MKLAKFKLTPPIVAISVALCAAISSFGATCTFNGAWDTPPAAGDDIVVTGGEFSWTATMPQQVASWTQSGGTVTFETTYDDAFPKLEVAGNVTLSGGTWTHKANANLNRTYRLYVSVGGNMTTSEGATIDASELGYQKQYMPDGGTAPTTYAGGTYGGRGGNNDGKYVCEPYGKYYAPEEPGSGMNSKQAGGAIRLDVAGKFTHNGAILTNGKAGDYYGGSGGSIWVNAASISGLGTMTANSSMTSAAHSTGSGGRVAIILSGEGEDFSNYDVTSLVSACSGPKSTNNMGAPGTIYLETAADVPQHGWLLVKGNGGDFIHNSAPSPMNYADPFAYGEADTLSFSRLTLMGAARLRLSSGKTLDIRNTVVEFDDKTKCGFHFGGGTLLADADEYDIDYAVSTDVGFSGVKTALLKFVSPAGLKTYGSEGEAFPGDICFDNGAISVLDVPLSVAGNVTVKSGSTLSCTGPKTSGHIPLTVKVSGNLSVEASGKISADGKGYTAEANKPSGPAGRTLPSDGYYGGSHGGRGSHGTTCDAPTPLLPYGSVVNPLEAGSASGNSGPHGGGIVVLAVGGTLANDGTISANALTAGTYGSAGGSVNVTAGAISGAGTVEAKGSICNWSATTACGPGGGGRIAVTLTGANADFSSCTVAFNAWGGVSKGGAIAGNYIGAPGTVYLRKGGEAIDAGTLIVDNPLAGMKNYFETPVGADIEGTDFGNIVVGRSARFEIYANSTITVSGVISNGCEFVSDEGSTVKLVGPGDAKLFGDLSFCNLISSAAGKTIEVEAGKTLTVEGALQLAGATDGKIALKSSVPGTQWNLVPSGGAQLSDIVLSDCNASEPITVINGTDGGNNSANVRFVTVEPGAVITWTGAASTAWGAADNWDLGRPPVPTDKVIVPAGTAKAPELGIDAAVAQLTIAAGAALSLADKTLAVTGDATIAGVLSTAGAATLAVGGDLSVTGTVEPTLSTLLLNGAAKQTVSADGATFYAIRTESPAADFVGNITAAAFTADADGAAQDLAFAANDLFAFGSFAVKGDANTPNATLRSIEQGGTWKLKVNAADVTGAIVSGSDATKGVTIVPTACEDAGGNAGWLFNDTRTHWTGAKNGDFTDAANWTDGVPSSEKDAVVEGSVACTVKSAAAVRDFTVAPGATVTVSAPFAVAGSVTIQDGATLVWDVPGAIAGNLVILEGGMLTHTAQGANDNAEKYRLDLTVGGSGYVAAGGAISVHAKGFVKNKGPGAPNGNNGASHAGRATDGGTISAYGSYLCPTNCGSGGNYSSGSFAGGGAAHVVFGADLTVDGEIDADALRNSGATYYTSAGGSIWIEAASLSGTGSFHANGSDGNGKGYRYGSGGRISVRLSAATSFDAFTGTFTARGGVHGPDGGFKINGTAGTVYLETAEDGAGRGKVLVNNAGVAVDSSVGNYTNHNFVDLPSPRLCGDPSETEGATFEVSDYTTIYLTADTRVEDIHLLDANSKIMLNGYTLTVHRRKHAVSPNDATQIVPGDGGKIEWLKYGLSIIVR